MPHIARPRPPRESQALTFAELLAIVNTIQEILWADGDGMWDPDKEWNSSTSSAIADVLTSAGLRPD